MLKFQMLAIIPAFTMFFYYQAEYMSYGITVQAAGGATNTGGKQT
jgi:hypothetical protein